tara:strand:+ start:4451 stop:5368 length:918 start_codon:yes stop_codon:yes gene_type:complete
MGRKAKRRQSALSEKMFQASEAQLERYNDEQAVQRELLEEQKDKYRQFEFKNPYADMKNQFEGMENFYEDMEVDMKAANFQTQQMQQQQANILQTLRGAAGSSGAAGIAQALANQGALQSQQIAAGIAQQERQGNLMARQGSMQLQMLERQGAGQADMTERGGAAMVQSAEMGRQSTLLGIEYGGMAGANAGVQSAYANQMAGFGHQSSMLNSQVGMWGQILGGAAQGLTSPPGSDRRLKKNINKIGKSPSGLNIYSFEYINPKYGKGLFQGVMSDEIPKEAVVLMENGYDAVNYNMLDVEFKQI